MAAADNSDPTNVLVIAVVAASTAPLLLLDGELKVVAASESFYRAFHIDPASAPKRLIFELGGGEWNVRQLRTLLGATASGHAEVDAYEFDLKRSDGTTLRVVLNARKLLSGDADKSRLLVSVTDVTDARAAEKLKDDLLREKNVLIQEIQHRIANSLQIVAAVLLQSARRVTSEETREHLQDAHNRVMSVAEVQRQLSSHDREDVALRTYFSRLAESIGASMIRDHSQLSLEVKADYSTVSADVSVSLGLIVTELVVNALRHAFPEQRPGHILVGYQARGPNWTLSVSDDGVGMDATPSPAKAGLGTSIINALAHQLNAHVQVADNHPGTKVSIVHTQIAAVEDAGAETFQGPAV